MLKKNIQNKNFLYIKLTTAQIQIMQSNTKYKTFSKKAGAVFRSCSVKKVSLKFRKIHRKTPVPESLLIKLQKPATKKEALTQVFLFSCEFCEISKDTIYYRTTLVATSEKVKH